MWKSYPAFKWKVRLLKSKYMSVQVQKNMNDKINLQNSRIYTPLYINGLYINLKLCFYKKKSQFLRVSFSCIVFRMFRRFLCKGNPPLKKYLLRIRLLFNYLKRKEICIKIFSIQLLNFCFCPAFYTVKANLWIDFITLLRIERTRMNWNN